MLSDGGLKDVISKIGTLPSLPATFARLQKAIVTPAVEIKEIGEIIAEDIAMTAKVMQLVNSSFFGIYSRVDTPARAVTLLGLDTIKVLVLGLELFSQIDQLLANLCVNARDAIRGVGKLTIETGNEMLDATYCAFHADIQPGDYVVLSVSDNGCGMTKEIQDKIFEPFFTTKDLGKGTGLGLATVYGIVKQNKGVINVYSEPGQGSTFKIYLPRHGGAVAKKTEEKVITAPGQGETVLIVEDEAAILRLTSRILTNAGYTVLTADSPAKAIRVAVEYKKDLRLIIVDVIMPEMNGRDLATLLQKKNPGLQCLFMSGYTTNIVSGQGVLEQEINFIQKPFSAESLVGMVGQLLPGQQ